MPALPPMAESPPTTDSSMAEQLSKNVTKILEDLLKDYDKTERPSFKTGKMRINMIVEMRMRPKFCNIDLSCIILSQQGLCCLSMVSLLKNVIYVVSI